MGFAEDKMWDYVKQHLDEIQDLPLLDMLDCLSGCLTQPEIEGIRARLGNNGPSRTAFHFMDELRRRKDWVNEFIEAIRRCKRPDIADRYETVYDGYKLPNRSQNSNIPPPSTVISSPLPRQFTPLPTNVKAELQARRFKQPLYPPMPPLEATNPESPPQSPPIPWQQAPGSSAIEGASAPSFTLSQEEVSEEAQIPTQESYPTDGVLTTMTHPANVAAMGFQHDPDLAEAASNPAPPDTKKGDFESRLSEEERATHPIKMPAAEGASSFTPFDIGRGKISFTPNTDRVVRRKELVRGNGDQDEPLPGRMEKVNETTTQQLHPSPPPAPSTIKFAPRPAPKSQIPIKNQQNRDRPDTTTSPATRETPVRPVQPPTRIQYTRPSANTGGHLHTDTRVSEEEEDQAFSKPGILNSVQPKNPATQRPASAVESPISTMNSSRLAIDHSADNSPCNESTLNRQRNEAHPVGRNEMNLDHHREQGPSIESSNSSTFTVNGDSLMISVSSTGSMPNEDKVAEEVDFGDGSPARGQSTDEAHGDNLNDNNAASRVSLSRNVPDEFDDANSMENIGHHEIHYSNNPSIDNYNPTNPVSSPNNILPGSANSQGIGGNENRNNNVPVYVLPAIAIVLLGIFLVYKSRQT